MHRGVGLAAFDRHTQSLQSYAVLSSTLNESQLASLHSQLSQFRSALTRFAADHRDEIRQDPAFRHAFQQMCSEIGVDPLAGSRRGSGSWWAEFLPDLGDWTYELGIQIVDVCVTTRQRNGGVIAMDELLRLLHKLRNVEVGSITEEDVARSIKTLAPLNAGYEIIQISGGKKMVRSVIKELDDDQAAALSVAQNLGGYIDVWALMAANKWSNERAQTALDNMLLRDGLCWIDEQDEGGVSYWVPSVMEWNDEQS